jgi:cytochrome c oxidase cbb3-type subunit III
VIDIDVTGRTRTNLGPLWLGFVLVTVGCNVNMPGKPDPKNRPVPADKILAFEVLYGQNCAGCHGKDGKLGPAPPLNDPLFRAIVPTSALEKAVNQGRPGTPMAAFGHDNGGPLTAAQIQVLVYQIQGVPYRVDQKRFEVIPDEKGLASLWKAPGPAPAGIPSYSSSAGGSPHQGATLFGQACAMCHGKKGDGIEKGGKAVNKINDRVFLSLISDQALRRIIITGRPDLKMPNYAEKAGRPEDFQPLTSSQIDDLVALLGAWRKGTAIPAP